MPKAPTRNRASYETGGGQLNEFEFQHNQEAMAEEERERFERLEAERREGEVAEAGPQSEAERIHQMMEAAHEKVARRKAKTATGAQKASAAGKSTAAKKKGAAKKAAAKKAAVKKAPAKAATPAKPAAKKGGTKKSGTKKGGAQSVKSASRKSVRRR